MIKNLDKKIDLIIRFSDGDYDHSILNMLMKQNPLKINKICFLMWKGVLTYVDRLDNDWLLEEIEEWEKLGDSAFELKKEQKEKINSCECESVVVSMDDGVAECVDDDYTEGTKNEVDEVKNSVVVECDGDEENEEIELDYFGKFIDSIDFAYYEKNCSIELLREKVEFFAKYFKFAGLSYDEFVELTDNALKNNPAKINIFCENIWINYFDDETREKLKDVKERFDCLRNIDNELEDDEDYIDEEIDILDDEMDDEFENEGVDGNDGEVEVIEEECEFENENIEIEKVNNVVYGNKVTCENGWKNKTSNTQRKTRVQKVDEYQKLLEQKCSKVINKFKIHKEERKQGLIEFAFLNFVSGLSGTFLKNKKRRFVLPSYTFIAKVLGCTEDWVGILVNRHAKTLGLKRVDKQKLSTEEKNWSKHKDFVWVVEFAIRLVFEELKTIYFFRTKIWKDNLDKNNNDYTFNVDPDRWC